MFDYHLHSKYSPDSNASMEEVVLAAIGVGLSEIAITDHFDPEDKNLGSHLHLDFDNYFKEFSELKKKYENEISLVFGIELGLRDEGFLPQFSEIMTSYPFDFAIGSVHRAYGEWVDFDEYLDKRSPAEATLDYYEYFLDIVKKYGDYDVLGHVNVIDRYISEIQPLKVYRDVLEEIFKVAVSGGKGVEINVSGKVKGKRQHVMPTLEILRLYKDLGGEIITIGSDAHSVKNVGRDLELGYEMAKEAGFAKIARYRRRKIYFEGI